MNSWSSPLLGFFVFAALCNGLQWPGPTPTAALEQPGSTTAASTPKAPGPVLTRRSVIPSSICGFVDGQAESPIGCNAGEDCGNSTLGVGASASLAYGCCFSTSSCSSFYTGCSDYKSPFLSDENILMCTANMSYCQSFTFPEVRGVAYECGTISDSTWRTVSLSYSFSTSSQLNATSTTILTFSISSSLSGPAFSSSARTQSPTITGTQPSTNSATAVPLPAASIPDLTLADKIGIGFGLGGAFVFIIFGIYLHYRRPRKSKGVLPPVTVDEKLGEPQATEVQVQSAVTELNN